MRSFLFGAALLLALAGALPAATGPTYAVLSNASPGSLVLVAGNSVTTLANNAGGYGLAKDGDDYIVANVTGLLRVSPGSPLYSVTTITTAPQGSQFIAVTVDGSGNYIVGDNRQHKIWRIARDGAKTEVGPYPVTDVNEGEDTAVTLDGSGNYVILSDNGAGSHVYTMTPAGAVTEWNISPAIEAAASAIIPDGSGGFLIAAYGNGRIYQITGTPASATLTEYASDPGQMLLGLARDTGTGQVVTVYSNGNVRAFASSGATPTDLAGGLANPKAVVLVTPGTPGPTPTPTPTPSPSGVPLPPTAWLVMTGSAGMVLRHWLRRRS